MALSTLNLVSYDTPNFTIIVPVAPLLWSNPRRPSKVAAMLAFLLKMTVQLSWDEDDQPLKLRYDRDVLCFHTYTTEKRLRYWRLRLKAQQKPLLEDWFLRPVTDKSRCETGTWCLRSLLRSWELRLRQAEFMPRDRRPNSARSVASSWSVVSLSSANWRRNVTAVRQRDNRRLWFTVK